MWLLFLRLLGSNQNVKLLHLWSYISSSFAIAFLMNSTLPSQCYRFYFVVLSCNVIIILFKLFRIDGVMCTHFFCLQKVDIVLLNISRLLH